MTTIDTQKHLVQAVIHPGGTATVTANGQVYELDDGTPVAIVACIQQIAALPMGTPIAAAVHDANGITELTVHPDGQTVVTSHTPPEPMPVSAPEQTPVPEVTPIVEAIGPTPQIAPTYYKGPAIPVPEPQPQPVQTFLNQEPAAYPAAVGFRGVANRLGLALAPTDGELGLRRAVRLVSQHWPGSRRIAVVNGKGGANKTPTTVLLSAAFARHGGGGVVAMDNNPTRGTLGWRTENGPHDGTVVDLVPRIEHLLSASSSHAELDAYVHHQSEDRYGVLRSVPRQLGAPITAEEFNRVAQVLSKYNRMTFFDSGNDESSAVWTRMIDCADVIVVATTAMPEVAESGRLLLAELSERDERSAMLARNAVVIVSQSNERAGINAAREIAAGFHGIVRATAVIPYDSHMTGGHLRWNALATQTRTAWIHAAAAIAEGL